MPIPVQCAKCGRKYQAPDQMLGKAVQCSCGARLVVAAPAASPPSVANWFAEELDAIDKAKEQSAMKMAEAKPAVDPLASALPKKSTRRSQSKGSLKGDVIRASIVTGVVFILTIVVIVAAAIYVSNNPTVPLARTENARKFGSGLGVLIGILIGIPWFIVAARHAKRREQRK
jgi:hypothetical protein